MKNIALILLFFSFMTQAQEKKETILPQINVSGEGKIKVIPDEAIITVAVENTGKDATEVKKKNDDTVANVVKLIKQKGISTSDFQTQHVSLYKNYDYNTKKYSYIANQTLSIYLKDLSKYDDLMMNLVETGINNIQGVEFKYSKIKEVERDARKKALQNALEKAQDFVSVLPNQKVGKALFISDNSAVNYPQPRMYKTAMMAESMDAGGARETLAIGEIEIITTVTVSFLLE